jgi:hypothetical protein
MTSRRSKSNNATYINKNTTNEKKSNTKSKTKISNNKNRKLNIEWQQDEIMPFLNNNKQFLQDYHIDTQQHVIKTKNIYNKIK